MAPSCEQVRGEAGRGTEGKPYELPVTPCGAREAAASLSPVWLLRGPGHLEEEDAQREQWEREHCAIATPALTYLDCHVKTDTPSPKNISLCVKMKQEGEGQAAHSGLRSTLQVVPADGTNLGLSHTTSSCF